MAAACALALVIGCSGETESGAVESVTLNAATLTLSPGATGKLTATVLPENADDKTVTWSSSDTEVATVGNDGTVTAVSIGEANITARAGGETAACAVTVCAHSYSGDRCTKCGFPKPVLEDGDIDDDGVLTKYTGNEATVVIPNGVTGIEWLAFKDCTALTDVTIPASVKSIEWDAFSGCESLETVTYNGTLAQWCAMDNDYALMDKAEHVILTGENNRDLKQATTLVIPGDVERIGHNAFEHCTALTDVTIPDGVTSIGSRAFYECENLKSVTIPASVTGIRGYAFSWCTSLTTINYTGTEEQWNAITKGINWDEYTSKYTITYSYKE